MPRTLAPLAAGLALLDRAGPADPPITGLAYDSREVRPGYLFFAIPGLHADGHRYIPAALAAGAVAVVHQEELPGPLPGGIARLRVADSRAAMSPVAAAFHGHPSRSLGVIGVTGTEGKSTTVSLAWQLLNLAGRKTGFFSTVMSDTGSGEEPNPEHQTTPEATAVQRMLAAMRDSGCEFAVVESSSHGLSPRTARLADVDFDVGVLMNVTHEHLEFHGTWENYRHDKANLFRALDRPSHRKTIRGAPREVPAFGVTCEDDPSAAYFRAATGRPVIGFSSKGREAEFRALDIRPDATGTDFVIVAGGERRAARIELPGAFNVDNAVAALIVASRIASLPWTSLVASLPLLRPVRGRMTSVDSGQPFEVIVDYAHTPSSFETIFPPLRRRARGRIFALFGSGGERDVAKRPAQGRIAAAWCDILVLADEDPRGEDPATLLEMIAAGCPDKRRGEELFLIPDRPAAIRHAFSLARPGDIVLLLGKGHENSIIRGDGPHPYDEIAEATAALAELGYPPRSEPGPRPSAKES